MECIFCSIISKDREAAYVYEDEEFMAIMDKYPINIGHTLVMPKKHYKTLLDMPLNDIARLFALTAYIAKAVVKATNADGFSIGQNNGEVANQIIPHVHVHIIPRYANDKTRWSSRRLVTLEQLQDTARKIRSFLEPIKVKEFV